MSLIIHFIIHAYIYRVLVHAYSKYQYVFGVYIYVPNIPPYAESTYVYSLVCIYSTYLLYSTLLYSTLKISKWAITG